MNKPPLPPSMPQFETFPGSEPVSDAFRIGHQENSVEAIADGKRVFIWQKEGDDDAFAEVAGWDVLSPKDLGEGFSALEMPIHARSAATVLAGLKAWANEKREIIDFVTKYQQEVSSKFGDIDTSLSLDTIGVTETGNTRRFFVTPPHRLAQDPADDEAWKDGIQSDVKDILGPGRETDELIESMMRGLQREEEK